MQRHNPPVIPAKAGIQIHTVIPAKAGTQIPKIIFVTGTDTDCGKTTVSVELLTQLNQLGLSTIALKPVASGADPVNEDVVALQKAASIKLEYDEVNCVSFPEPIAPHIAAQWHHKNIQLPELIDHLRHAQSYQPDVIVIEGAGGWCVPLADHLTFADYVHAIGAQVFLVVGVKLGCLNHSLLTHRAIIQDGVPFYGWYPNIFDPEMLALEENIDTLTAVLGEPLYNSSLNSLTSS